MNLVVDIGNTSVKLAVFRNGLLLEKIQSQFGEATQIVTGLLHNYAKIKNVIISNVGKNGIEDILEANSALTTLRLSKDLKFPFINKYKTPETLGVDRLALVAAAYYAYPNKNCLIIDAGTCITYDFLKANGHYLGGSISPGLGLRYKSLNQFTARLPLLEKQRPEHYLGQSTSEAIHTGIVLGLVSEIDGFIDVFKNDYPDLTVILTGGDGNFLSNQLKNSIFANSNFLLEGLNHILDFNRI